MKRCITMVAFLVLTLTMVPTVSLAQNKCAKCAKKKYSKSVKDKFFKKVHAIYANQEKLGISDKQLNKVKDLKLALKKEIIRKDADIEILKIDIKSLLYADKINVGAINKLIDQKYDAKKAKSKKTVESYAQLKKILSEEQQAKLKSLWKKNVAICPLSGSPKGSSRMDLN